MRREAIDVNELEAQFSSNRRSNQGNFEVIKTKTVKPAFIIGGDEEEDDVEGSLLLDDQIKGPVPFSYAAVRESHGGSSSMTVEELEAQLLSGLVVGPKSPVSQLVGAGPPPGLNSTASASEAKSANVMSLTGLVSGTAVPNTMMSSTAPLLKNDPNFEFMNRFERNLIMKIHTTQLTTATPMMDDFYYQALTKRKATTMEGIGSLLYFPLPSAADRQREFQRRERRRKQREKEREKEQQRGVEVPCEENNAVINVDLVLGKVSHSSSRKPRQQLQMPSFTSSVQKSISLHEQVMRGIEAVYNAVIAIEDFHLLQEEENGPEKQRSLEGASLPELCRTADAVVKREMRLQCDSQPNLAFVHFLTIPKGRAIVSRALGVLDESGKEAFVAVLVAHFDFLDVVRPETPLAHVDAFISQVLSPLVAFIGEAEWPCVLSALTGLYAKTSFVWLGLTKAGMVLICILLSRLEILKAANTDDSTMDEAAPLLTEQMFDAFEGHLLEFFSPHDPSRDFYAWQCLALLAMNVESDRKRAMILELRDKILSVVEEASERPLKNLNVFLNALGLDASQLQ
jgi:DNA topoisomerase 2-associated protein PAT1